MPIDNFRCPSFPGNSTVPKFGQFPGADPIGAGNYVALAASSYFTSACDQLQSGYPDAVAPATAAGLGCPITGHTYCGNGAIPFPGITPTGNPRRTSSPSVASRLAKSATEPRRRC